MSLEDFKTDKTVNNPEGSKRQYSNEDIEEAIEDFVETVDNPTSTKFSEHSEYPSLQLVKDRYGGWSQAILEIVGEEALIQFNMTDEQILDRVIRLIEEEDMPSNLTVIDEVDYLPSYSTVRDRFGSSKSIVYEAGKRVKELEMQEEEDDNTD